MNLIARFNQFFCPHREALIDREKGRMSLWCPACNWRSGGWDLRPKAKPSINLLSYRDARRKVKTAA